MPANRKVFVEYSWDFGDWCVCLPEEWGGYAIVKAFLTEGECLDYVKDSGGEFVLTEAKDNGSK